MDYFDTDGWKLEEDIFTGMNTNRPQPQPDDTYSSIFDTNIADAETPTIKKTA